MRLRGRDVRLKVPEADDIAGEGKLDDFAAAVLPAEVVAQSAALDAIELAALVAGVKKHFAPRERARQAGAAAVADTSAMGGAGFGLGNCKHHAHSLSET